MFQETKKQPTDRITPHLARVSTTFNPPSEFRSLRKPRNSRTTGIKYLHPTEIERLISVITDPRDLALFAIIYYYGLRVSEATLLTVDDVNFAHETIFIRRVKNGICGEYSLFLRPKRYLECYLPQRQPFSNQLFTGRQGDLSPRRIQQLFRMYADQVGLERYTVHSLRHSIATHLSNAGHDIADIQKHLGHVRIESSQIYAQITDIRRQVVYRTIEKGCPHIAKL